MTIIWPPSDYIQTIFSLYFDYISLHFGYKLYFGYILTTLLRHSGRILIQLWLHSKYILIISDYILTILLQHFDRVLTQLWLHSKYILIISHYVLARHTEIAAPVLRIEFGPPHPNFGSVWSPQKARNFRHFQQATNMRILCFHPQLLIK